MSATLRTPLSLGQTVNDLLDAAQVNGVNCQCVGTMIVLRGQVGHPQAKQQAVSIARQCCGMNEISNEIHVVG
jgi:osmotically-inducible protein OsmY